MNYNKKAQGTIEEAFGKGFDEKSIAQGTIKRPFEKWLTEKSIAQGTIEYLVIMAVVVVLSLVVVALFTGIFSSPSQQILDSSSKIGSVSGGGISIVESVADLDGNSLVELANNYGDFIYLTKITLCDGVVNNYGEVGEQIVNGDSKLFSLSSSSCVGESKSCEIKIEYTTRDGLNKSDLRDVTVMCVGDSTPNSGGRGGRGPVNPIPGSSDSSSPVIVLFSPTISKSKSVDFNFSVSDDSEITSCTLFVGNDSNTYSGIENGENTIVYTFDNDELVDWNISCVDSSQNTGVSSSMFLNVDFNLYQIKTCLELQDMNTDLYGNYVLLNSIDCSSDTSEGGALYNEGAGFSPIGYFEGTLDGNNFTINGLNIYRPFQDNVGLFGYIQAGYGLVISNLNLLGVSVTGKDYVGGLVGKYTPSGIGGGLSNLEISGSVNGENYVGGLVGSLSGNLNFSGVAYDIESNASVSASGDYVGGLTGYCYNFDISHSNSLNSVSGFSYVGGLIGYYGGVSMGSGELTNSYSWSSVAGQDDYAVGGLVGYLDDTSLSNSYSTGSVIGSFPDFGFSPNKESSKLFFAELPPVSDSNVGGLVGVSQGIVSNSFYDSWTSGQTDDEGKGFPKTTVQMKQQSTFVSAGWDFTDVWLIREEGNYYPELIIPFSIG